MPVTEAPAPGPRPGRATMRGLLIAPAARLHHASAPLLPPDYSSPTGTMWDLHVRVIDLGAATKPALRGR